MANVNNSIPVCCYFRSILNVFVNHFFVTDTHLESVVHMKLVLCYSSISFWCQFSINRPTSASQTHLSPLLPPAKASPCPVQGQFNSFSSAIFNGAVAKKDISFTQPFYLTFTFTLSHFLEVQEQTLIHLDITYTNPISLSLLTQEPDSAWQTLPTDGGVQWQWVQMSLLDSVVCLGLCRNSLKAQCNRIFHSFNKQKTPIWFQCAHVIPSSTSL